MSDTCCPGREDCDREHPPRLFRLGGDTGCWAIALDFAPDGEGGENITEYHMLAEIDCTGLTYQEQNAEAIARARVSREIEAAMSGKPATLREGMQAALDIVKRPEMMPPDGVGETLAGPEAHGD
jgi:hypothetical protein